MASIASSYLHGSGRRGGGGRVRRAGGGERAGTSGLAQTRAGKPAHNPGENEAIEAGGTGGGIPKVDPHGHHQKHPPAPGEARRHDALACPAAEPLRSTRPPAEVRDTRSTPPRPRSTLPSFSIAPFSPVPFPFPFPPPPSSPRLSSFSPPANAHEDGLVELSELGIGDAGVVQRLAVSRDERQRGVVVLQRAQHVARLRAQGAGGGERRGRIGAQRRVVWRARERGGKGHGRLALVAQRTERDAQVAGRLDVSGHKL